MKKLDLKHGYTVQYGQLYNNGFCYCLCVPNGDDFKARMEYTTCKDYMQDIVANMYRNDSFSQYGLTNSNHLKLSKDEETYHMAIFFKGTEDKQKEGIFNDHLVGSANNIITLVNHFDNLYNFKPASIQECELIGHPVNYTNCLLISFDKNWYNSAITISFMNILIKIAYAYTGGDVKDFFNNLDKYNMVINGHKIINGNEINYIMTAKRVIDALIDGWLPPATDWSLYDGYHTIHNAGIVKYNNLITTNTELLDFAKEAKESYTKFIELCQKKELITT